MDTPAPPSPAFYNPMRRNQRILLGLAAAGLIVAGVSGLTAWHLGAFDGSPHPKGGLPDAAAMLAFIAGSIAPAMLICGLATIPAVRKADRCFAEFRRHHCLAEWTYGPDQWGRYVEAEDRRLRRIGWAIVGLVGGPLVAMGVLMFAVVGPPNRVTALASLSGAGLVGAGIGFGCNRLYAASRRRRMAANPVAVVSAGAIYCGGDFAFWGSQMVELRSARVVDGPLPIMEVIVGTSTAGRAIGTVAEVALLAVGRAGGGAGNMTWRYAVLVPDGRRDEAERLVSTLAPPRPAAAMASAPTTAAPMPTTVAARPAPLRAVRPPPLPGRPRPLRWWVAALVLLVVGLVLMAIGAGPTHAKPTAAGTAMLLSGVLLWAAALVTAVVAVVQTVRSFTRRAASAAARPAIGEVA